MFMFTRDLIVIVGFGGLFCFYASRQGYLAVCGYDGLLRLFCGLLLEIVEFL